MVVLAPHPVASFILFIIHLRLVIISFAGSVFMGNQAYSAIN